MDIDNIILLLQSKYIFNKQVPDEFNKESENIVSQIYLSAFIFYNNNNFKQATVLLRFLTLLKPLDTNYWKAFASALYMDKEYQRAISCYNYLTMLLPKDPYAFQHLAESYLALKDMPAAWENLNYAKKLAQKNIKVYADEYKFIEALSTTWKKFIPEENYA